ncbi:MAG TPA: aminopeptidase P family protein [Ohtaekwangia sp.]|nr:aminopeptidase P family protein [Ohtaekwangia sp.]
MKKVLFIICLVFFSIDMGLWAQTVDRPEDFLTAAFHKDRREQLRKKLPKNSVAVFFANAERNRSNDVDYPYHQDPDFYYLTGYREPHAVLFIFKEKQIAADGTPYDEIIFVQPRNIIREMRTGRRLGDLKTKEMLGLEQAFNNTEFAKYKPDFSRFDQILFFDFMNDVRDDPRDPSDLYDLIAMFKEKVNYPSANTARVKTEPEKNNLNTTELDVIMDDLRGIKTADEISLLRKAVAISCMGQNEVMKAMKPGLSEREIQGIHEFVFKKYQAEELGYPSIVGGGHNGCILHYTENYKPAIDSKELVLMDLGAEYHGYTADITRTIPASGKFSPEQKAIYDLVLRAQEEAMKICKPGTAFDELRAATKVTINKGLKDLGIIANENEDHQYYPHGCCHHIGLDVHDRGHYNKLQENMVITIEPGIYIPENANCDKRWWGIAVRIEDDFLITANGYEHLSHMSPRTTEDIERLMKQRSVLDDFVLPDLESQTKPAAPKQ